MFAWFKRQPPTPRELWVVVITPNSVFAETAAYGPFESFDAATKYGAAAECREFTVVPLIGA